MTAPVTSGYGTSNTGTPFSSAVAGGEMGKNEFIKLLVAQMTNQDPLNPVDGQQMASQLAQFSSVEQLMNLGIKLDAQGASNEAMLGVINNSAAVSLIGKTVMVADDHVAVGPNGTQTAVVIVPPGGGDLSISVTDINGNVVRNIELGRFEPGEETLDIASALEGLPEGAYRIRVENTVGPERDALAIRIPVHVDGVRLGSNGAHVTAGSISYPIGLIESIRATIVN